MRTNLLTPIFIWVLCFCSLFALKLLGKWHLSGYVALFFFLVLPSIIEKSNKALGLILNIKEGAAFLILCLLIFGGIYLFIFFFIRDFEILGIKISPGLPKLEDIKLFFVMLVGVAFPEELFFRGFMQSRFNDFFGKKFSLFGVKFGYGLLLSSVFFMLVHIPQSTDIVRFLTFFPGLLFGFLREKYNSIFQPAILHAISNMFMLLIT